MANPEMTVDEQLEKAGDALESKAETLAPQGGLKAKLAAELTEDTDFLRKLKPSLIKARAQGRRASNDGKTGPTPTGPQLGERAKTKKSRGPSPWLVLGVALALGIGIARALDWRGHAYPRD